jgi:hypothetical protein
VESYSSTTPVRSKSTPNEIVSFVLLRFAILGGLLGLTGYILRAESWAHPSLGNILVDISETLYKTIRIFLLGGDIVRGEGDGSLRWAVSTGLLHVARFLAPVSFYGMLFRALFGLVQPHLQRHRLSKLRNHTIVCGLGETGRQFVLNLMRRDPQAARNTVVIESRDVEAARSFAVPLGIELVEASPREAQSLIRANVREASSLVIVTDDDSANLDIAALLPELVETRSAAAPLEAHMEVRNDTLLKELTDRDAFLRPSERLELRPFNVDVLVARRFFAERNLMAEADLRDQKRVHLLFVGFDSVGLQILLQLARIAPYRDFARPFVTLLVAAPDDCREALSTTYPELAGNGGEADADKVVELKLKRWAAEQDALPPVLMRAAETDAEVTAIIVCLGEDALNARTALLIRSLSQREAHWRAPLYVHQRGVGGLGRFVQAGTGAKDFIEIVEPFGMLDEICRVEDLGGESDAVAKLLHEAYLALRGESESGEPQPSMRPWRRLDEIYRRANRRAADHIPVKLASAGFHVTGRPLMRARERRFELSPEELRDLARLEHESWMNGQKLAGWRRGAQRDDRRRYHEFLVPFDALTKAVQEYDYEQVRVVLEKVVAETDADKATVFRERRIGIFAGLPLSRDETDAAVREFSERALPALLSRYEGDWLTIMTRLIPGAELSLCEMLLSALDTKGRRAWRLVIVKAVPERVIVQDAMGQAAESEPRQEAALADELARRLAVIARPETVFTIDLTPPALRIEDWLQDTALRSRGNARARDYLLRKCDVVIDIQERAAQSLGSSTMAEAGRGVRPDAERLIRLPTS